MKGASTKGHFIYLRNLQCAVFVTMGPQLIDHHSQAAIVHVGISQAIVLCYVLCVCLKIKTMENY